MKTIDINNVNIQKLKLENLVADAVARNDKNALEWLQAKTEETVDRHCKDGTVKKVAKSVNMYRVEYLEKFHGYEKQKAVKVNAADKRKQKMNALFGDAFAKIQEG